MSTSTPIGAVVVEVQTEEELAIPVSETAQYAFSDSFSDLRPVGFFLRKQPCREPPRGALLFPRKKPEALSPENESTQVPSPARYYGPPWAKPQCPFRALLDLPTPSNQLPNPY